jgi:hypothetical protein
LKKVLASKTLAAQLARLLDEIISQSADATGYTADDFEDLKLGVGTGNWSSVMDNHGALRVEETQLDPSPPIRPSLEPALQPSRASGLLTWEILPPGWWHNGRYLTGAGTSAKQRAVADDPERIIELENLAPVAWYVGDSLGTRAYFVAEFKNIAVADCPEYGNALYYYSGASDWRTVFRRSKPEATRLGARRILHKGDWRGRLRLVVMRHK